MLLVNCKTNVISISGRIIFRYILGIIIVTAIIIAYWLGKGASILYNKVIKNIRF